VLSESRSQNWNDSLRGKDPKRDPPTGASAALITAQQLVRQGTAGFSLLFFFANLQR
jgi:hypothetical protein